MRKIRRSQLPAPAAVLRAALAKYHGQMEAHRETVGVPAPWPDFEMVRELARDREDFEVVDDEAPDPETLTAQQEAARSREEARREREEARPAREEARRERDESRRETEDARRERQQLRADLRELRDLLANVPPAAPPAIRVWASAVEARLSARLESGAEVGEA